MSLSYNSTFFKIYCKFFAKFVGKDDYGNTYYKKKNNGIKNNSRERRFVIYKGMVEASKVPQEWNAWLHHVSNDLPKKTSKKSWMKDHLPNMTGTPYAYEYKDQKKLDKVKNIYSIWKPDEN